MFKKTFFVSTAALLLCFFTSCSLINSPADSGSVKLTIPARSITGLPESEYQGLMIDVSLKGDYSLSQTFPATSDAAANFENLKIGSKVFIEANVYFNEPEINEKYILYTGNSDTFTVTAGVQEVTVVLKKIYSVIFESYDDFYGEQRIISGGTVIEPKTPEKVSEAEDYTYTFDGWYEVIKTDESGKVLSETPFDFTKPIKDDLVLHAKWIEHHIYTVSFNLNGGNGTIKTQKITDGKTAAKPEDPQRDSNNDYVYEFIGWYQSDNDGTTLYENQFDFSTPITKSIVLYANWKEKQQYTITFDSNNGTGEIIKTAKVTDGDKVTAPETSPTKEADNEYGYEFAGWFTSDDNGKTLSEKPFDFNTAITGNITLYAGWTLIPYVTVTFDLNGGIGEYAEQRVLQGKTIERPSTNPKKDADAEHTYSFVGWYVSTDDGTTFADSPFDFTKPVTEDTVLYAVWTTKAVYTITFDLNGGDGTNFEENVIVGDKLTVPSLITERKSDEDFDYTFAGWFTSDDEGKTLSSTPFNFNNDITGNLTLYAGWTKTAYYHVTFITNGGNENIAPQRIENGKKAQEPETPPTKDSTETDSYEFVGWFTSVDEGTTLSATPFDFDTPITKSIILYAKWDIKSTSSFEVEIDFKEAVVINVTKTVNEDEGKITFTADSGYSSYEWKWDNKAQTSNTNTLTVDMPKTPGVYRLLLIVDKESDEPHSQTMEVTIR